MKIWLLHEFKEAVNSVLSEEETLEEKAIDFPLQNGQTLRIPTAPELNKAIIAYPWDYIALPVEKRQEINNLITSEEQRKSATRTWIDSKDRKDEFVKKIPNFWLQYVTKAPMRYIADPDKFKASIQEFINTYFPGDNLNPEELITPNNTLNIEHPFFKTERTTNPYYRAFYDNVWVPLCQANPEGFRNNLYLLKNFVKDVYGKSLNDDLSDIARNTGTEELKQQIENFEVGLKQRSERGKKQGETKRYKYRDETQNKVVASDSLENIPSEVSGDDNLKEYADYEILGAIDANNTDAAEARLYKFARRYAKDKTIYKMFMDYCLSELAKREGSAAEYIADVINNELY